MKFFKKSPRLLAQYAALLIISIMTAISVVHLWRKGKAGLPPAALVAAEQGWMREMEEIAAKIPREASVGYLSKATTTPSDADSMYQFMFVFYGTVPLQPIQEKQDAQYLIIKGEERPIPKHYTLLHKTHSYSLYKQDTHK